MYELILILSCVALGITGGDPRAQKGGQFTLNVGASPKSLIYYLTHDKLSASINEIVLDSLLARDDDTYEFIPNLAKDWKVSPDKMTFTFTLNPLAKFSDGKPVTAEDVKFTWETITNPKHNTAPFQSYLSSIASCEISGPFSMVFKAKFPHFKNLEKIAGILILPKHFFSQGDFNKAFHQKILGSGPYVLEEFDRDSHIALKRNLEYWGASLAQNRGKYNFDRLIYKFIEDPTVAFEAFKRGDTDAHLFNIAKVWKTETQSEPFTSEKILTLEMKTKIPSGSQGIYWNMRRPIFADLATRTALAHLMNRERWTQDLFYGLYSISSGILNLSSDYHSPNLKPIPYDPKKAKMNLKKAGWISGEEGVLTRNDQRFEFDILSNSPATSRYLTLYQEDLKKMGIKMQIRIQDWPVFLKLIDDRQFDAIALGRTADTDPSDFSTLWGSSEADKKGSSNVSGLKDSAVDSLADKIDKTFERKQRIPLVRKIEELITQAQPYALTWESSAIRFGYWNRFSYPNRGYLKYSDWWSHFHYWWADPKKRAGPSG